jgi:hypothetical protein
LRQSGLDVSTQAKEAFITDLYRQGRITRLQLGQALGLDRFDVDAVLKRHKMWRKTCRPRMNWRNSAMRSIAS